MTVLIADIRQAVNCQRRADDRKGVPFVRMSSSPIRAGSPLGERILAAAEAEGRSIESIGRDLGMSRGHINRIVSGARASQTLDVEMFARMAKLLHVRFSWLVLGDEPMRRGGRGPTAAEEAIRFARQAGAREDAIQLAWERNKDREKEMTQWDWVNAINAEAQRLAGTPRPEHVKGEQQSILREKKRLERARGKASEDVTKEPDHHRPRRAANHR